MFRSGQTTGKEDDIRFASVSTGMGKHLVYPSPIDEAALKVRSHMRTGRILCIQGNPLERSWARYSPPCLRSKELRKVTGDARQVEACEESMVDCNIFLLSRLTKKGSNSYAAIIELLDLNRKLFIPVLEEEVPLLTRRTPTGVRRMCSNRVVAMRVKC